MNDNLDLEYARMVVMSGSRKGFLSSAWVSAFLKKNFQYEKKTLVEQLDNRELNPLLI